MWQTTDPFPAAEREEAWETILSASLMNMSVRLPADASASFRGRLRRQWLDDVAVLECFSDPFVGRRTAAHLISDEDEFVAILLDVAGAEFVAQRDTVVGLRPRGGVALASRADLRFEVSVPYRKRCLVVPVEALRQVAGVVPRHDCIELPSTSPAVALLDGFLSTLTRTLSTMSEPARSAARNAALQLVAGALHQRPEDSAAGVDSAAAAPALRASMDAWIDRHLVDQRLSVAGMAAAHAVSVRTVHRLFSYTGDTFGSVVRARRLDRAREDLAAGDHSVATIAARWGFSDASHFARSFKRAFGMSPREFRSATEDHPFGTGASH